MLSGKQTHTSVHSRAAALGQRQGQSIRDHFTLSGILLYAQVVIGCALVLYEQVSTPGYISILLLLLPMGVLYAISLFLSSRSYLREKLTGKIADGLLFICLFLDAQFCLYAFSGIVREILPDYSSALISFVTLLCVLPSLRKQHSHALPSLARLMKYPLLVGLGAGMLGAARMGRAEHLFPLLGRGTESIVQGSVWMLSALSAALTPLYIHQMPENRLQRRQGAVSLALGLLLGAGTALLSAFLLPFHFLALPDAPGAHLLLAVKVHPALFSWSVTVCLMMLLLLIGLAASLSRGLHLLSHATGRPVGGWLGLLLVPLPAISTDQAQRTLIALAPVKTGCMLAAIVILSLGLLGKKGAGKG